VNENLLLTQDRGYESTGQGWKNIFATSTSNYDEEHVTSRLLAALANDSVPVSTSISLIKILTNSSVDLSDVTSTTVDREFSPNEYPYHGEARYVVGISRYGENILGPNQRIGMLAQMA